LRAVSRFAETLNEQVAREFAASQQYVAIAVHFDGETLPRLAAHFYRQALEERNHAMMIVQYLLDSDSETVIPGVEAPQTSFAGAEECVALALAQERQVTEQIVELTRLARDEGDLVGEQFLHWFLAEQREEVASMSGLLSIVRRAGDNLLLVEDFLARGGVGEDEQAAVEAAAPPAAGGAL
jgi:ferritin